jgi:P27 family predicted phage terminase small subunit
VEQRRAEGNPGKRPLPAAIVPGGRVTVVGSLEPPEWLMGAGLDWWRRVVPELEATGLLARLDQTALETMATLYGRLQEAREALLEDGITSIGSQGQAVTHPAAKVEAQVAALLLRFMEQYGLTPVARARAGLAILEGTKLMDELDRSIGPNPRRKAS